jgi:hypothetical protein
MLQAPVHRGEPARETVFRPFRVPTRLTPGDSARHLDTPTRSEGRNFGSKHGTHQVQLAGDLRRHLLHVELRSRDHYGVEPS